MAKSLSQTDKELLVQPTNQEAESQLSSLVYDMSQQVQTAMENMLMMINEIDQNAGGITEDIEKSKQSIIEKKNILDEEKERFQRAAFTVLDMLGTRD